MHISLKLQPLFILLGAAAVSAVFLFWPQGTASKSNALNSFVACLNEKNVVMYGNDRCENCEVQKKMFGTAFEKIQYVNCDFQDAQCKQQQIQYTPTWVFGYDTEAKFAPQTRSIIGTLPFPPRVVGVQSFSELAQLSSCTDPKL